MLTVPVSGAVLHIGNYYSIQLFEQKQTSPSIAMQTSSGKTYYASLRPDCGHVKIEYNGSVFGLCDEIEPQYTRLEYLESTGRQYIDTGIVPTGTTSFELKTYIAVSGPTSTGQVPVGARTHIKNQEWYYQLSTFNEFPGGYMGYGPKWFSNASLAFRDINVISFVDGKYTINQQNTHTYDIVEMPQEFQNTLYVFRLNSKGSSNTAPDYFTGRIYYLKIWDGNTLLRDYIPVLDANGVPAMYDRVSNSFFYNIGSGQFQYNK